ncbi:VanZ family protein [Pseudonocardiaceae bacterium YIM PH 21723]|nr:VanZ family protein [Pseudonocardiaceae bacterium YIM PH 21723]
MNDQLLSGIAAIGGGSLLAFLLFLPWVARQYRLRGELGFVHTVLSFAVLVYGLALLTYTLLPLPETPLLRCSTQQLVPFQFVGDFLELRPKYGVLGNPALRQFLFNVALFVPLGMFARHLFRRGVLTTTLVGFGASLFIECTQRTGNWFLYPCAYRLFDVDDLLANTAGAPVGWLLAPVLALLPGQQVADPGLPRPLTARRRLFGMLLDLTAWWLTSSLVTLMIVVVLFTAIEDFTGERIITVVVQGVVALVFFLVIPLRGNGASLGQRIVRLRPVRMDGTPPSTRQKLRRSVLGMFGYSLLSLLGFDFVTTVLFIAHGIGAIRTKEHRGLSAKWSGLRMTDDRTKVETVTEIPSTVEHS